MIGALLAGVRRCDNFPAMHSVIHRRNLLRLAAGLPLLALAGPAGAARAALIERLIAEAKAEWAAGPFGGRWPAIPGEHEFIPLPE